MIIINLFARFPGNPGFEIWVNREHWSTLTLFKIDVDIIFNCG